MPPPVLGLAAFPFRPATALAPLEGLTTAPIRELMVRRGGLGLVCTEFVRIHQKPSETRLRHTIQRAGNIALSVQLMGNDPSLMGRATRLLADAGADVIDINLGCPTRRAVRRNVGSGLLRDHELLRRVLDAMRTNTTGLLSVKLRAGFDRLDDACELGRLVEASGADYLVVHPRRRVDLYRGVADWRIVSELVSTVCIPVVGNGDVWYAGDAIRLRRESGCQGVMIGRPALRNPWIFRQLAELDAGTEPFVPAGDDLLEHLAALHQVFCEHLPPHRRIGSLKEHVRFLGRAIPDAGTFLHQALRLDTTEAILDHARTTLSGLGADDLDLGPHATHGLESCPPAAHAAR